MSKEPKRAKGLWGRALAFCGEVGNWTKTLGAIFTALVFIFGWWTSYRTGLVDAGAKAEKERQVIQSKDERLATVEKKVEAVVGEVSQARKELSSVNSKLDLLIQLNGVPVANRHRLQLSPFAADEPARGER